MGKGTNLDILERGRVAMILQADNALVGKTVFRSVRPLTAALTLEPVISPCLKLQNLLAIQPVLHMSVVEDYLRAVPLAHGFEGVAVLGGDDAVQ